MPEKYSFSPSGLFCFNNLLCERLISRKLMIILVSSPGVINNVLIFSLPITKSRLVGAERSIAVQKLPSSLISMGISFSLPVNNSQR